MMSLRKSERPLYRVHAMSANGSRQDIQRNKPTYPMARNIAGCEQLEKGLLKTKQRFALLSDIAGQLLASDNPQGIFQELCQRVMEHLECDVFLCFAVEERTGTVSLSSYAGIPDEAVRKIERLNLDVAVSGCAPKEAPLTNDESVDVLTGMIKSIGIQAHACHPLMVSGKVTGILAFGARRRTSFSSEDLVFMKAVTDQLAAAMERMRLMEELRKSQNELECRVQERTELEGRNKELQESACIASHDLCEPLRKIQAFGSYLESKSAGSLDDQAKDYLSRMMGAANRMQDLLGSLLRYSRIETKGEEFRPVRLADVVQDAVGDLEIAIRNAGAQVEIGALPTTEGDPSQLWQLFQNLIANALKYRRPEVTSHIRIFAEEDNGAVRVLVEDNGIGFDEKHLEKIFQPFQRLHGRKEYPGVGLGLAICKRIVERHGWTITARSAPGRGSTFMIHLAAKQGGEGI